MNSYDVCIYGSSSAAITAGIQCALMGIRSVIISPEQSIGGLTTGGLGQTDIGNKHVIGGLSREFYRRVRRHYSSDAAWTWQNRSEYRDGGQTRTEAHEDTMWTFEPSAASAVMNALITEHRLEIWRGERLALSHGSVRKTGPTITEISLESGKTVAAKIFLDCTYEGDLMAYAGVSYFLGREANWEFGESLNGVQTKNAVSHQVHHGISPYIVAGDPHSGLLPGIDPTGPGSEGSRDFRVQAYCYRLCLTNHPANRITIEKPQDYNPLAYEILLRNFEAGEAGFPWINSSMPNCKTDTNNRTGVSTDFIGQNYSYAESSYADRRKIADAHWSWQMGLLWTLMNHPRIPAAIREPMSAWGLCKDEFTNGRQEQLYVREARRMRGEYTMTEAHCTAKTTAPHPIGMAAYGMDSHNTQRYVDEHGFLRNEGDVQVKVAGPYPIAYESILPKRSECSNLLVPVCLSATHIAYGSIRMEPVFMVLGQSAATAAALSLRTNTPLHHLDHQTLTTELLRSGQILS